MLRNTEHFGLIVDIHFHIFGKRRPIFGNAEGIALSLSRWNEKNDTIDNDIDENIYDKKI